MKTLYYYKNEKYILSHEKRIELNDIVESMNIRVNVNEFLKGMEKQNLCRRSLEDIYRYDEIPMYIFLRPALSIYLKKIFECVEVLSKVKDALGEKFDVKTDDAYMNLVCNKLYDMNCEYMSNENRNRKKRSLKYFKRIVRGLKSYVKFLISSYRKDNILIMSQAASISVRESENGEKIYYDSQYGKLIDMLEEKYNPLNFQFLHSTSLITKSLRYSRDYVPLEFMSFFKKVLSRKIIDNKLIQENFRILDELDYCYEGIDYKQFVKEYIEVNGRSIMRSYLKEMLFVEKIIKKFKIKKCIVIDEGDRGRCFIVAGNRCGIDTYALQHGIISKGSYSYDVCLKEGHKVIPKKTFLWGEKYRKLLIERTNIYNEKNSVVSGQVRTDYLLDINKENFKKSNKMRVLYISQYMEDLVKPACGILIDALKNCNTDVDVIIKLHPGDTENKEYYEKEIKRYKLNNVKMCKDEDLYMLLYWSDIVISVHSTVIIESALLNKPSVCIKLPKYNDICGYVREGISLGVNTSGELINIIENFESSFDNHYFKRLNNYVGDNFCKVDGKVAQRIYNEIIKDN